MTIKSIVLLSLATPLLAHAVPNVFVDGQRTSAEQMNRNFEYLEELNSRILTNLEEEDSSLSEQIETLSQLIADVANSQISYSGIVDSNTYSTSSIYAYSNRDIFEPYENSGYGFSTFVIECDDEEYIVPYFLTGSGSTWRLDNDIVQNIVTSTVNFVATHTFQDISNPVPLRIFNKDYMQPTISIIDDVFETISIQSRTVSADLGACGVMTYDQPIIIDGTYQNKGYSQEDFEKFIGQFRRVK